MFRDSFQKTQHVALNACISMSNIYYCAIMHNYVIVLLYNVCMTLVFFYFLLDKLFARSRYSQNQLNSLVEKMGKNSISTRKNRLKS